jgi:hypothetical protein
VLIDDATPPKHQGRYIVPALEKGPCLLRTDLEQFYLETALVQSPEHGAKAPHSWFDSPDRDRDRGHVISESFHHPGAMP